MSQICSALILVSVGALGCTSGNLPADVPWVTAVDYESHEPYFPISSGSKHQDIRCDACHGNTDTFSDFTCINCHKHEQDVTDASHAAVPDYTYEAQSCFACHPRGEADGAGVAHDAFYPIGPGTTHEAQACADCHIVPGDRTQVSCIDCHSHDEAPMATQHGGTPGYAWQTQACLGCHRDGDALSRDVHDEIFPISMMTRHSETTCQECHIDATDRENVTCVDCHAHEVAASQTAHQPVGGYMYDTRECMKCHFDASVPRVQNHRPFRIDVGSSHEPNEAECLKCHTQVLPDRPFVSADFSQFDCLGCHLQPETDREHQGQADYRYDSQVCVNCHMDGEAMSRESHDTIFPISMATAHAATDCGSCHADANNTENVTCVGCHYASNDQGNSATDHTGVGGYQYSSPACLKCHDVSAVFPLSQHRPFRIDSGSKHRSSRVECLECHINTNQGRPFPAADFELFTCTQSRCHAQGEMDGEHRGRSGYAYDSLTCVKSGCHPDGQED